jgi:hypothetical protein
MVVRIARPLRAICAPISNLRIKILPIQVPTYVTCLNDALEICFCYAKSAYGWFAVIGVN